MMDKIILDNDLFVILAGADLLDDWLTAIDISHESVYVLPELVPILKKGKSRICKAHCPYVIEASLAQVIKCKTLSVVDDEAVSSFEGVKDIDIGEQKIFAHLISGDYIFAGTNDKRSIKAVCSNEQLSQILEKRMVCLEQCLYALLQYKGWEAVNAAVAKLIQRESDAGHTVDSRLRCLFPQHGQNEQETKEAWCSNMRVLSEQYGAVLFPEWQEWC